MKSLRVACIQVNAGEDWKKNLQKIRRFIRTAIRFKPAVIALPETFYWRGRSREFSHLASEVSPKIIREFQDTARHWRTAFLLGSVLESSDQKNRYFNTSILISEKGRIAARYRKIHLFHIALPRKVVVQESRYIAPGRRIVSSRVWGIPVGLTICYDLRFPELFRRLTEKGSRLIFVPSNFTETTGQAHWEVLLRARAIENQVFIVAPAQVGVHPATKIKSFGTSLIIDPWGRILGRGSRHYEEIVMATLDLSVQNQLRRSFPVLEHRRL